MTPPSEWHGWTHLYGAKHNPVSLHIGPLPGRKSIALYRMDGGTLTPLAYFPSIELARAARDAMNFLVFGEQPKVAKK